MSLRIVVVALCLLLASFIARAEPASEASVRRLLDLTGAGAMGIQVVQQMVPGLKKMLPDAPDEFWEQFMADARPEDLVDLIVPIYQRHLSEEDVQAAITYFSSPAGKRMIGKQGVIMQESYAAGQQWGAQLAERAIVKLRERKAANGADNTAAPDVEAADDKTQQGD